MKNNKFITTEGIDGCGKTTQTRLLVEWLCEKFGAENVVHTFEPGGVDKKIRAFVLDGDFCAKSELFLFLVDRLEHVRKIILPALELGKWVVCERYTDSTIAYQSTRGIPKNDIENFFSWCEFPNPDLTIFFDISVEIAAERLKTRGGKKDNFEAAGLEFMRKLSLCYARLACANDRIVRVNAELDINEIAREVRGIVQAKFEL